MESTFIGHLEKGKQQGLKLMNANMGRETKVPYNLHFSYLNARENRPPYLDWQKSWCHWVPRTPGSSTSLPCQLLFIIERIIFPIPQKFAKVLWSMFFVYSPTHSSPCAKARNSASSSCMEFCNQKTAPLMEQTSWGPKDYHIRGMVAKGNWETN